jgi:predicted component of type VI protein secretion system
LGRESSGGRVRVNTESQQLDAAEDEEAVDAFRMDLEWLFNASSPLGLMAPELLKRFPRVAASVLNFGLRSVFGQAVHDPTEIDRHVAFALKTFEPRLQVKKQTVRLGREGQLVEIDLEGTLLTTKASRSLCIRTDLSTLNTRLDSNG